MPEPASGAEYGPELQGMVQKARNRASAVLAQALQFTRGGAAAPPRAFPDVPMTDLFREVDEEVQRDKVAQFFQKHQTLMISGLLAIVIGVGGYRAYSYFEQKKAAEAGAKYESALALSNDAKAADAKAALEALSKDSPAGYQVLAKFRLASDLAKTDAKAAAAAFEALSGDAAVEADLKALAKVRAGALLVDTLGYDDIRGRLEGEAAAGRPWRLMAREALGIAAYKAGKIDEAEKQFEAILADPEASQIARQRAEMMMALGRSGVAGK